MCVLCRGGGSEGGDCGRGNNVWARGGPQCQHTAYLSVARGGGGGGRGWQTANSGRRGPRRSHVVQINLLSKLTELAVTHLNDKNDKIRLSCRFAFKIHYNLRLYFFGKNPKNTRFRECCTCFRSEATGLVCILVIFRDRRVLSHII